MKPITLTPRLGFMALDDGIGFRHLVGGGLNRVSG